MNNIFEEIYGNYISWLCNLSTNLSLRLGPMGEATQERDDTTLNYFNITRIK